MKRKTLDEIVKIVNSEHNGSLVITQNYINNRQKLDIVCEKLHLFSMSWHEIVSGEWCKICSRERGAEKRRMAVDVIESMFKVRNERCLNALEYRNDKSKLLIVCPNNHTYEITYHSAKIGQGCSICSVDRTEMLCRSLFEHLTGEEFPKLRMITNPKTGRNLEIDGFCQRLGIGFEYNGIQHYQELPHWKNNLQEMKERDALKIRWFNDNGLVLIVIPGGYLSVYHMRNRKVGNFYHNNIWECEKNIGGRANLDMNGLQEQTTYLTMALGVPYVKATNVRDVGRTQTNTLNPISNLLDQQDCTAITLIPKHQLKLDVHTERFFRRFHSIRGTRSVHFKSCQSCKEEMYRWQKQPYKERLKSAIDFQQKD